MNIPQSIALAREHHRAGRLAEAEAIYREILAHEPRHADALHLLGVLAGQTGRNDRAVDFIRQSIALRPDHPEAHKNLGVALKSSGQLDEAIAAYRQAIALQPGYAEAHKNLGAALYQRGQLDEAIAASRRAIALQPDFAEAHNNLGIALTDAGQLEPAITACRHAIGLRPDYADAHHNLGNALYRSGQPDSAIAAYRTALQHRPRFPAACHNLGIALTARGRTDEAIAQYQQAIAIRPDYAEALGNLGHAFKSQGRLDEAIAAYRRAIALQPDSPAAPDWRHVLAALTGDHTPATTPASHLRKLFDSYAADFDDHLVQQLHYRVPGQLLDAIVTLAPGRHFDILDLGCGTGLCGVPFRPIARSLTGVDLSQAMIARATARGIYDHLLTADLTDAMSDPEKSYDLILAGDSLNYIGDLAEVFRAAARTLRRGGHFAFSLERHDGPGFILHARVCFAHSLPYLRAVARTHHFTELRLQEITIRKGIPTDVPGWIIVLQKDPPPLA